MITPEEARNTMMKIESNDAYYGELQEELKLMATYIAQQEKKDKLFERLFNVCKEYKHTSIGLSDDSEFLNVMVELEEEMK